MKLILEITILSFIYLIGYSISSYFQLLIPPAFVGMGILFFLLTTKTVRLTFFQASSAFLNRHVILFLLPIMVGLMDYGSVLKAYGFQFILIIVISTIIAFCFLCLVLLILWVQSKYQ